MSSDQRPSGLIANKGLEVLTWGTPNGHKVTILLEEIKEAYGTDYVYQGINIGQNIQKEPWFTKLGPNGRIPVLVDHDRNGFPIQEGAAILQYLTRYYDPEHRFNFPISDAEEYSNVEQWVAWQHGGLGPMQGQANHFYRLAKERIAYGTQRYVGEAERLLGILDARLADRDYLVGPGKGRYTIADIANFSWSNFGFFSGVNVKEKFPNLWAWLERINARPAVQKGTAIPSKSQATNPVYLERIKNDPEFAEQESKLKGHLEKAQEQYNYKYSSP